MAGPLVQNGSDGGLGGADFLLDFREPFAILLKRSRKPQESQLGIFPPGALDKLLSPIAKHTEPATADEPDVRKISEPERLCSRALSTFLPRHLWHESPFR